MSDCVECWSTPCECGHEWRGRTTRYLREMRDMIAKILAERAAQPQPTSEGDVVTLTTGRRLMVIPSLGAARGETYESWPTDEAERREAVDALDAREDARKDRP